MTDVSIDDVNDDICLYHYMTGPSRDIVPHESYNKFCFLKKHLSKKNIDFCAYKRLHEENGHIPCLKQVPYINHKLTKHKRRVTLNNILLFCFFLILFFIEFIRYSIFLFFYGIISVSLSNREFNKLNRINPS